MIIFTLSVCLVTVFSLLSVAFYTVFERKVLGLAQLRVGPHKSSFFGILQPLLDGLKLLTKAGPKVSGSPAFLFIFPRAAMLILTLQVWGLVPSNLHSGLLELSILFFTVTMGLVVYNTILAGIISKSKFGMLGAIRRACQSVSYEISLRFQLLSLAVLPSRFILGSQTRFSVSFLMAGLWWVRCVCECNRAPFDFAEGERELIRGFNVEYSAVGFVFIFLSEYGIMLALSLTSSCLFFNSSLVGFVAFFFSFCIFRATFPRYRFDLLMKFCWLAVLPLSIAIFVLILYLWAFGVFAY